MHCARCEKQKNAETGTSRGDSTIITCLRFAGAAPADRRRVRQFRGKGRYYPAQSDARTCFTVRITSPQDSPFMGNSRRMDPATAARAASRDTLRADGEPTINEA